VGLHPVAAQGFARNAEDYERTRPSYPAGAVAHLVAELGLRPGCTLVDVAAGTGKLTRLLVPAGARVVAVEPVAEMVARLAGTTPGADVLEGTAERLPLAGGSADAVTVAQAFHWFDGPRALDEFHRVLRPGGGLGVVYNMRDGGKDWQLQLNRLLDRHRGDTPQQYRGAWREAFVPGEGFTPLEERSFDNPQRLTPEGVVGRCRSLSYVGALDPVSQEALLGEIEGLLASHPETRGRSELTIAQRTVVWTWRRC